MEQCKKKDLESTMNEEPERTINQEDMMKKHTPPPFPKLCMAKRESIMHKKFLNDDWRDVVEKALLDLGTSVNLLPYSVYKQLGLGELKPTSITLSLADRSVKIPRGMIEDVLVQVDKFYYLVDFVVLDTDPEWSHATYIWQHDVKLNIFYLCKKQFHPEEEEGPEKICLLLLPPWKRREEIPFIQWGGDTEAVKEEPPKLILKPLPMELKYAYLKKTSRSPVVISSSLTTPQEDCLLKSSRDVRRR
ncbi:hypothetical protein CK203_008508 [Vitis vinifera]|uniref:Uncharacterized protein n=1 Tax=Vitis vinifera TaxID=29760 RepID=A0A438KP88_VITVI|nr:hypothetical protein CK203_008508 [Vitis vinifera]